MTQVAALGIPALITPLKVSRDTIRLGLFCYDLNREGNVFATFVANEVPDDECVGSLVLIVSVVMERLYWLRM